MAPLPMNLDVLAEPGRRRPLFARHGAVVTSQPLAAQAGLRVLQDGGSAADAAIATAACLTVVEPCSNGLGSDAFALVWDAGHLHGLNGSGRSPAALSAADLRAKGWTRIPPHDWASVTVSGAVQAWADLHERFGRLPFERVLQPAIEAAEQGFLVTPVVATGWRRAAVNVQPGLGDAAHAEWPRAFTRGGQAPAVGELWRNPEQAATLRALAASKGREFYEGSLAQRLVAFAEQTGGYLTAADLAAQRSEWVKPISASYRGYDVWEIPPSGQGIAALMALQLLDGFDPPTDPNDPDWWHLSIEAIKLGLTDAHAHVADPDHMLVTATDLLAPDYAEHRRGLIGGQAGDPIVGVPRSSDTVYLATADESGQQVSFIQSNFNGFGSHIVVPGTGIALQNRGSGFSLAPGHPNELAGGKRPFHTIIPGFLTRDGEPIGPFGVMGAHMQPQGHVQVISHTIDGHDDPQTALDRPRWHWDAGRVVWLEPSAPAAIASELRRRGHDVHIGEGAPQFGRGQIIWRVEEGYLAASESRADGYPSGW